MPTAKRSLAAPTMVKLAELGVAAPQVVAHRLTRMALAGATPSARDRNEFTGMVVEKQVAFAQAWMNMFAEGLRMQQQLELSMLALATSPQRSTRVKAAAFRAAAAGIVEEKGAKSDY